MTPSVRLVRFRLEDGTRDLLGKEITERVAAKELDSDTQEALVAGIGAHALNRHLPGEILQNLHMFSATATHALLITNLPVQDFPTTPTGGFTRERDLAPTNALHLGLIQLLALTPFAVPYENDGKLIRNVVPNPAAAGTASSWGADTEFSWHTDNPHLPFGEPGNDPRPYIPRYLTFYAIRNKEEVPTELVAADAVTYQLDAQIQHQLQSTAYHVAPPASNNPTTHSQESTALLEPAAQGHHVRYDPNTTTPQTPAAANAVKTWSSTLAMISPLRLNMQAGQFLIFDNYRTLHRRPAFTPHPDRPRWLRRCYAS